MFQTPTSPFAHREPIQKILERSAVPLLLFGAVLFVLLFVSWFGILPRFTRFAVADLSLSPTEMDAYVAEQRSSLSALEEKRDRLVLPEHDAGYTALKNEKRTLQNALDIKTLLLQVAGDLHEVPDAIVITHIDFDSTTSKVSVTGDVQNVALRSMTVLASYIENVEALPVVKDFVRPSFTRAQNADGTFHSPFKISFRYLPTEQ